MKKLLFILSIASMALLNACNEKIEPATLDSQSNATPSTDVTAKVSAVIKAQFPEASNLKVSSLDDNKMYGVDFSHKGENHESVVSKEGKILSSYNVSKDVTLPEAIKNYLETTYKSYSLEKAYKGTDANGKVSYKVHIEYNDQYITIIFDDKNVVIATFIEPKNNVKGDKNKVFVSKLADLPASIQTQLTGYEFIGAVVKVHSDNSKKTYFVTAKKDGIIYEFTYDNDGKLVKTVSFDPSKKPETKEVKQSDLPQVIQDYIKINYKDWKFEKAAVLMKNGVIDSYSVFISKDKKLTLLTFDKDGKFLKSIETPTLALPKIEEKALAVANIPVAIKTYLDKTYVGWVFTKGSVTLKDGVAELYYVYITVGADKYHVYFDKDGKFLAAKRG